MLFFYVTRDGEIYKLPYPRGREYNSVIELANAEVLAVTLVYSVKNKLPYSFVDVSFERIMLDGCGQYLQTDEEIFIKTRNYCTYSLVSAEELSSVKEPWAIPYAPILPTAFEKQVILNYLKHNYSVMFKRNEMIIEDKIVLLNKRHRELINIIKRASAIRRKINKSK